MALPCNETLIGNAASIAGDVVNDTTVVFDQATDVSFSGDLSGSDLRSNAGLACSA